MHSKTSSFSIAALVSAFASLVAHGATLTLGEASLSGDRLTVPVTVDGASSGTLTIVAAEAAPRDGEPAISSGSVAASQTISAPGTYSMTFTVTLGTKVAYRAELGGDASATGETIAYDNNEYFYWKTGVEGNWHDKNNWTIGATDGYRRLGYPGYVTKARVEFPSVPTDNSQTNIVHIDTSYTIYKLYLNHSYIVARLAGVHGDELLTITGGEEGISQDRVANVTFDHVRVTTQNWPITRNDSLSLVNGAYLTTRWWIHINGANAKLYVGSGSEIRASYEWWYGISLSGENAEIEIDDGYVYTPRLRIGANGQDKPSANQVLTATPKGVVFKGNSPKLEIAQEFASIAEMPNNPVFEFHVPANGFAAAPVVGSPGSGGLYQMLGADYLDHAGEVVTGAPVVFKVNSLSPFFEGNTRDTIVLVDWSEYGNGGIYKDRVVLAPMDDPSNNYLSYDGAGSCVFATLSGNGGTIVHPVLSDTATAEVVDDNLVVSTDVSALPETGTTTARLYIGVAGPNGDPKTNMTLAAEAVVSAAGSASLSAEAVLGSQMAYAIVLVYENGGSSWSGSTTTNAMVVSENGTEYVWVNDTAGVWSDPANWTCSASDGKKRLGYPAYGCRVRFYGNQTAVVEVDGPYTGLGDSFMDNTGLNQRQSDLPAQAVRRSQDERDPLHGRQQSCSRRRSAHHRIVFSRRSCLFASDERRFDDDVVGACDRRRRRVALCRHELPGAGVECRTLPPAWPFGRKRGDRHRRRHNQRTLPWNRRLLRQRRRIASRERRAQGRNVLGSESATDTARQRKPLQDEGLCGVRELARLRFHHPCRRLCVDADRAHRRQREYAFRAVFGRHPGGDVCC